MSTLISRLYSWVTDKGNSVKITASRQDAELDQLIVALNRKTLCSASEPGSPIAGQTWVDTTNKLLKIYFNNEWVIHGPVHIAAAAATTPYEGMLWYDTGNNLLKSYTGAAWQTLMIMPGSTAQGDILYLSAADTLARLGAGTAGDILKSGGAAANPEWLSLLPAANGGTGCTKIEMGATGAIATGSDTTISFTGNFANTDYRVLLTPVDSNLTWAFNYHVHTKAVGSFKIRATTNAIENMDYLVIGTAA